MLKVHSSNLFLKISQFFSAWNSHIQQENRQESLILLADFLNQNQGFVLILDVTKKNDVVKALETNQMDLVLVSKLPQ